MTAKLLIRLGVARRLASQDPLQFAARLEAAERVVEAARIVLYQNAPPKHGLAGFYGLKDALKEYDATKTKK